MATFGEELHKKIMESMKSSSVVGKIFVETPRLKLVTLLLAP